MVSTTPAGRVVMPEAAGALALLLPALLLPRLAQHAIAGTSLLLATALVNLIPENPYLPFDRRLAGFSNVFSFHGLTGLVDSLWPYAALAYLSALGLWRGEHLAAAPASAQPAPRRRARR